MPRILVIARPRSGSTAVMELLGTHPEIQSYGELLNPNDYGLPTVEEEIYEYINEKLEQKPGKFYIFKIEIVENVNAPGWPRPWNAFKIHAYQKDEQKIRWDTLMHYCGIEHAIVVWRKEVVESIVSAQIAKKTGEWYSNQESKKVTSIEISKDFLEWRIQEDVKNWSDLFEQWPIEIRPIFVQYEELFYGSDSKLISERFQTVFEQLGIETCDSIRCYAKRQNPASLEDKVKNWNVLPETLRDAKIDVPALFNEIISRRFLLPKDLVQKFVPDREPRPPLGGFKFRVADPFMPKEVFENVNHALTTGNISSASYWPKKLTSELCKLFSVPVAIPCNTGFTSLVLALQSAYIGTGDEVIMPSFTMIAVANVIKFVGATPIFVDVEEKEYNPSWDKICEAITKKTKAVIVAHTYGSPAKDVVLIAQECKKKGLVFIVDISEAVGISIETSRGPKLLGTFGDYACASMYVNKMLHGGDGGFVLAKNPAVGARLTSLLNHGFTKSYHFVHFEPAINGKINGIGAAVACGVLDNFSYVIQHRQKVAELFRKLLSPLVPEKIQLMPSCGVGDTPWVFGIHCISKTERTRLRAHLAMKGIETRDYFFPMHLQPAFRSENEPLQRLENSEILGSTGFYLPTHPNLKDETVKFFCDAILDYFGVNNAEKEEFFDCLEAKSMSEKETYTEIDENSNKIYVPEDKHIVEKSPFDQAYKDLLKRSRNVFMSEEKWDDKKELVEEIRIFLSNPIANYADKDGILADFLTYFEANLDIEKVDQDSHPLENVLPQILKEEKFEHVFYLRSRKATSEFSAKIKNRHQSFDLTIEEINIPENGYNMNFPFEKCSQNSLILLNLNSIRVHQIKKLTGFYEHLEIVPQKLIILESSETSLPLLTQLSSRFQLVSKHGATRIYEPKSKPVDTTQEWEAIQEHWNSPLPRKMKFAEDPDWDHHHKNAYNEAIRALKKKFHDENAEVLFISAVEQYICDCEETPKQPWVGVIHGIPNNPDHFYVPDLEKLCTKSRFRPWLKKCVGLFTLTSTQREYLQQHLPYKFPIVQLKYPSMPVETSPSTGSNLLEKFKNGEEIPVYFIGSYDRDFDHFFQAKFPNRFKKVLLECDVETSFVSIPEDVTFQKRASGEEYEKILQENLVFLALKNGGAANTLVIECIARNVPIIAPKMASIVDYIGEDYPLLYDPKMLDFTEFITCEKVQKAVDYLQNMDKTFLTQENFVKQVETSSILAYMRPFTKNPVKYEVTISICSWKRTHNLEKILDSLLNQQTFRGSYEIIIWNNNSARQRAVEKVVQKFQGGLKGQKTKKLELITSSENHFCSIRFAMVNLMYSDKLLICDDDIIPGPEYIEFFVNNHQNHPQDVLCLRGNYFLPHEVPAKDPHTIWTNYDAFRFVDDHQEECLVHYVHADACLIPKAALHEVASTCTPDTDYMLVDDYWMSYVLCAKFGRDLRKLKISDNVLFRTSDSDEIGVALYTRKDVANARTRMYLHHMNQGWPNFEEYIPFVDEKLKQAKIGFWDTPCVGFNINSEITDQEIQNLADLGIKLVRVGIVGVGRDEGFEFSDMASTPKLALDQMDDLARRLQKHDIKMVLSLDDRVATERSWSLIAEQLCSYSNVVGYDLFNEPFTSLNETQHWHEIRKTEKEDPETEKFLNLHKNLIKAIRAKDAVTPIIVEALFWANIATLDQLHIEELKELDDNIIASIHYYLPQNLTWRSQNKGRYEFPGHVPIFEKAQYSESIYWCQELIEKDFEEAQKWSVKHGIKVFVGEFGISRDIVGAEFYLKSIANAFHKFGFLSCLYAYRDPDWETMDYELGKDPRNYRLRSTEDDNPLYKTIKDIIKM